MPRALIVDDEADIRFLVRERILPEDPDQSITLHSAHLDSSRRPVELWWHPALG